jgi:hypothetical protein
MSEGLSMGPWSYAKIAVSQFNTETAGPSCKKTSPSVRNSTDEGGPARRSRLLRRSGCEGWIGEGGLPFAAASALLAGRRGGLQRAGGDSRCWGILRADASRHLPENRTGWRCGSRTRVSKMSFQSESAESGHP